MDNEAFVRTNSPSACIWCQQTELDEEDEAGSAEPYTLSGSNDRSNWQEIGQGNGDTSFDLNGVMSSVRYLKIEPTSTDAEFDGVRVLYPLR